MPRNILLLLGIIIGLFCTSCLAQEIPEGFRWYRVKEGDLLAVIAPLNIDGVAYK